MYSKDVYSYLAQSQISGTASTPTGWVPHRVWVLAMCSPCRSPACGGIRRPRTARCFLWIGRGISGLTGENIVAAVLCHRLVVLAGVVLIVWATPRLARRCGVAEVSALWLGAANPLADHAFGRRHP